MKILHINTHNTGGAAKACLRLHKELLNKGVDSKVLVRSKTFKNQAEVYEIWEDLNFFQKGKKVLAQKRLEFKQSEKLSINPSLEELFSSPESIWDITASKLYMEADIIHLHWVAGFVDYISFFSKCNKNIVWTLHDYAPFSGGFHYPQKNENEQFSDLIDLNKKVIQTALNHSNINIVSPSNYLMQQSLRSDLFGKFKHNVIKNPTSPTFKYINQKEARKELKIPQDRKIVLFVADELDYKRKGLKFLLETVTQIKKDDIHFYVIGKGTFSTTDNIFFLGEIVDEAILNKAYAAADLFLIPSLDDNSPNTISESLCSGTPVVGFNVGGIPEMLTDENSFICEKITSESLLETTLKGLETDWDRKKISENARRTYSSSKCAKSYLDLYQYIV